MTTCIHSWHFCTSSGVTLFKVCTNCKEIIFYTDDGTEGYSKVNHTGDE